MSLCFWCSQRDRVSSVSEIPSASSCLLSRFSTKSLPLRKRSLITVTRFGGGFGVHQAAQAHSIFTANQTILKTVVLTRARLEPWASVITWSVRTNAFVWRNGHFYFSPRLETFASTALTRDSRRSGKASI